MVCSRTAGLLAGILSVALSAGVAHAQIGRSDAPIEIKSSQASYLQNEGRGIYTGNVVATQGDSRITTDKLTVVCQTGPAANGEAPACEAIEKLIAEGNIYYTAPDVRIKGDRAQYDYPTDTITITGDVILSRGKDGVVRGKQVVYKVGEGRTIITGGQQDRVTSIFTPARRDPAATPAPAPESNGGN